MPLACEWTDEKNASIDWSNPKDAIGNHFTFLQLLEAHPALRQYYEDQPEHQTERAAAQKAFLSWQPELQETFLTQWFSQQLLQCRNRRWCRCCGLEGHTKLSCPTAASVANEASVDQGTVLRKFHAHLQRIERKKLLEEKKNGEEMAKRRQHGHLGARRTTTATGAGASVQVAEAELFSEERRRGLVARLDEEHNIGFMSASGLSELKFFVDRVDSGIKSVAVGDMLTFRLDMSRDYPVATDVRYEKPVVTAEDVKKFIARCKATLQPIQLISMLLMHSQEWHVMLRWLYMMRDQLQPAEEGTRFFADAVHTLIELATYVENCEPIHAPVLDAFLRLMCTPAPVPTTAGTAPAANAQIVFYPSMVADGLSASRTVALAPSQRSSSTAMQSTAAAMWLLCDRWLEAGQYVTLLRQHIIADAHGGADAGEAVGRSDTVQEVILSFCAERVERGEGNVPRMQVMMNRLRNQTTMQTTEHLLIPSAEEFSIPPPNPSSVFDPSRLPINGKVRYSDTELFIRDQCTLLRADTFEATSRLLPALCYNLEDYTPTAETTSDMAHARLYYRLRYLGKVLTRDRDFSQPESYLLEVHTCSSSSKANLKTQLHQGTTVCISTGLDATVMANEELFWGVISSSNTALMQANVIVVSPCEGSASFEKMAAALARNEAAGLTDRSMLLETSIFMAGYTSIMKALNAFRGPLAMMLPMAAQLVGQEAADAAMMRCRGCSSTATAIGDDGSSRKSKLIGYIPSHCAHAFREITADIQSRFSLDEGQDTVMRQLPYQPVILVQGPPGTGKSFIGSRVVEAYVRFKQLVSSGDILQKISIDQLSSARPEEMLPTLGPVVVITYKNHALDEFLVDLLNSGLWEGGRPRVGHQLATGGGPAKSVSGECYPGGKRLIRIGGRSRESILDGYNLGSLVHGSVDRTALNGLKERLYMMNQRLERLTKEVHYLENGKVPRLYFERWLTVEQRQHMRFEDREAWLAGERFLGAIAGGVEPVSPSYYQTLLQTRMAVLLQRSAEEAAKRTVSSGVAAGTEEKVAEAEDDVSRSVFQEMKQEDERQEVNDSLSSTYLSTEAIALARKPPVRPADVPTELLSLWSLPPKVRHSYYAYLIQATISTKAKDCLTIIETIKSVVRVRNHAMDQLRLSLLQGADVVGLTTTGCAMNQNLLRSLRPSVLVVEEAAEVLESQLLACMTDSLQQIILIGDHFQLQPKVETFLYEKVNHLNLSLFERLSRSMPPARLTEQRRMHPDISRLVRPFYAPQPLIDHKSVLRRPFITASCGSMVGGVPGLQKRVFFWRHRHPEEEAPGSRSKVNTREIRMVEQAVAHLVSEGVLQKSITVITPYLGQCRMLRGVLRLRSLADVKVSTVDLYQGDENDIILLSLVRTEKLTEFIKTRNRLIVSCSRARFAMVMVGNDTLLRQCVHWKQVLDELEADQNVGEELPITYRAQPGKKGHLVIHDDVSAAELEKDMADYSAIGTSRPPAQTAAAVKNENDVE